jgi:GDSL-like Lipase/Acylhydrolase family
MSRICSMFYRGILNLCALLLGILLALGMLEVALRIHNPVFQTVKNGKVVLRANYDETRKNDKPGVAPQIHIHNNAIGFRGEDPPPNLKDWLSLITVGGSTTRSALQSDGDTWTALLGNALRRCFNRVWINNAGFDGHTSFAHLQLIRNYIVSLQPKIVVMLIGANDATSSFFVAGGNDMTPWDRETVVGELNFDAGVKGFIKSLSNRSELVTLSLTLYRSLLARMGGGGYEYVDWAKLPEVDGPQAVVAASATCPTCGDEAYLAAARKHQRAYEDRLRLLLRLLHDAQILPVLMTQPTPCGFAKDPTTGKNLSRLPECLFRYQLYEIYNDTLRYVAQSEGVLLIDLSRTMPKDTKYYWDYMHYTDAGEEELTKVVTRELLPYIARNFPLYLKVDCQKNGG